MQVYGLDDVVEYHGDAGIGDGGIGASASVVALVDRRSEEEKSTMEPHPRQRQFAVKVAVKNA